MMGGEIQLSNTRRIASTSAAPGGGPSLVVHVVAVGRYHGRRPGGRRGPPPISGSGPSSSCQNRKKKISASSGGSAVGGGARPDHSGSVAQCADLRLLGYAVRRPPWTFQLEPAGTFLMARTSWGLDIVERPSMSSAAARRSSSALDSLFSVTVAAVFVVGPPADCL